MISASFRLTILSYLETRITGQPGKVDPGSMHRGARSMKGPEPYSYRISGPPNATVKRSGTRSAGGTAFAVLASNTGTPATSERDRHRTTRH